MTVFSEINRGLIEGNDDVVVETMTMPTTVRTIEALKTAGLRSKVKIMVGGAPTTKQWADEIGADGWADEAPNAVNTAAALIGES